MEYSDMANVERFDAFPTCIYRFKHNFEQNQRKDMIDLITSESIIEKDNRNLKRLGSQENNQLHKNSVFKPLVDSILDSSHDVMEDLGYVYDSLQITNMWGNILKPNSSRSAHPPHTHSNNFLSGTFYLQSSSKTSPIIFFDPRPQASIMRPRKKDELGNNLNADQMSFDSQTGYGVIFPSWLQHWVPQTNEERISIAWNILPRGDYGEPNTLQNAHI